MNNSSQRQSVFINLIGETFAKVCVFLSGVVLARGMNVEDYGIWTVALAWFGYFLVISDYGASVRGVSKLANEKPNHLENSNYINEINSLRLTVAVLILSVTTCVYLLFGSDLLSTIGVLCVGLIVNAYNSDWIHRAYKRMLLSVSVSLASGGVFLLACIIFESLQPQQAALWKVTGMIIGTAVGLSFLKSASILKTSPSFSTLKNSYTIDAFPIVLSLLIGKMYFNIDLILIENILGVEDAGNYAAIGLFYTALVMARGSIVSGLIPFFSSLSTKQLVDSMINWSVLFFLAGILVLSIVYIQAAGFIEVILTDRYLTPKNIHVLKVFVLSAFVLYIGTCASIYVLSTNRSNIYLICTSMAFCINLTLNLLYIPKFGIIAAAYSTLAAETTAMLILAGYTWNRLRNETM